MCQKCALIHEIASKMPRHKFPFKKEDIFTNGIYLLFEKGEIAHETDRIVRIGTHRGDNNLYNRLKEHFINENKDRSIFRKNIGRAFLNKTNDPYLSVWELDFQEKKIRDLYGEKLDLNKQQELEKKISNYIQENLSFVVIEIPDKESRLFYESKLISTISACNTCQASENWLGKYSPKEKIVASSLWLVNELYKEVFTKQELNRFINKYILKNN